MTKMLTVLSWLFDLSVMFGLYILVAAFFGESGWAPELWMGVCLLVPLAVSWAAIRRIRNFFVYLAAAAAVTAGMWALLSDGMTTALTLLIFLIRASAQIKKGKIQKALMEMPGEASRQQELQISDIPTVLDIPRLSWLLVSAAVYLAQVLTGREAWLQLTVWLFWGQVALYVFYVYLDGMEIFIREQQKKADFPGRALRRIGWSVLAVMLFAVMAVGMPAVLSHDEPLEYLRYAARKESAEKVPSKEAAPIVEEPSTAEQSDAGKMLPQMKEPPVWLTMLFRFLEKILFVLAAAAFPAALFLFLFRKLRGMAKYYTAQEEGDEVTFLGQDEENSQDGPGKKTKRKEAFWGERMRIRRKYRRFILKNSQGKPGGWETPEELEQRAGVFAQELHIEYERARYDADRETTKRTL